MSIAGKLTTVAENQQKVYDAGYADAEQEFWDAYMNGLNGSWNQKSAFAGPGWNDKTFNPNQSYNPWTQKNCEVFFKGSGISDLAGILLSYHTVLL